MAHSLLKAQPWIFSARFDLGFILAPALAVTLAALAWSLFGGAASETSPLIWLMLVVGVDVAHVYSTLFRTYLDRAELSARPWLYGIARHVAVDVVRASVRTEPRAEVPDVEVDPMTAELLTLHDAIDQLPTEQRQVIELKYLVGMSNAEVAAAMDTSPGAINAKQWRALKALADVLEDRT